jgi:hypothetical protein
VTLCPPPPHPPPPHTRHTHLQPSYPEGAYPPLTLLSTMVSLGMREDVVGAVAAKLLAPPFLSTGVVLGAVSGLLRSPDLPGGAVGISVVNDVKRRLQNVGAGDVKEWGLRDRV